jgi:hypothetical protein
MLLDAILIIAAWLVGLAFYTYIRNKPKGTNSDNY